MLKAVPPPGHKLTPADLDRSVSIMRQRVDKLGVSEPEIRKQGTNQIVIQLPGVRDPQRAAKIIGATAQLQLFDLETAATGPSAADAQGNVQATTSLFDLLAGQQARIKDGKASQWYLFDAKTKKLLAGPADEDGDAEAGATQAAEEVRRQGAEGREGLRRPEPTARSSRAARDQVICPARDHADAHLLLPLQARPEQRAAREPVPADEGRRPEALGHAGRHRHDDRPARGAHAVHRQGRQEVPRHHADGDPARTGAPATRSTSRSSSTTRSSRSRSSTTPTRRSRTASTRSTARRITGLKNMSEAKGIATVLQTGALPVNFQTIENTRSRRRSARTRSSRPRRRRSAA